MRLVALIALAVLAVTCGPSPDAKLPSYFFNTGGATAAGTGGATGTGGRTTAGTGGRTTTGSGGATGVGGVATGVGGRITGVGGRTTGTGGTISGVGGTIAGVGGRTTGMGGRTGTGGASTVIPDSGAGGSDGGVRRDVGVDGPHDAGRDVGSIGAGGIAGTGGITGAGGTTTAKDAAPASDSAGNCLSPVLSNGYTCGSTPACSACVINGVSQEAGCKKGLDCLEAAGGASCIGSCQLTCLNAAGDAQIQKCITAIVTAACGGTGC
jgi:hypothetical protein